MPSSRRPLRLAWQQQRLRLRVEARVAAAVVLAVCACAPAAFASSGGDDHDDPAPTTPPTLLFMDLLDVTDTWGLIEVRANTVVPDSTGLKVPPGLNFTNGAIVFATLPPCDADRGDGAPTYEVYAANTLGHEPLLAAAASGRPAADGKTINVTVLRYTTDDFVTYSAPAAVLTFETGGDPYPYGMTTVKSIARDTATCTTVMVVFDGGVTMYKSTDAGQTFLRTVPAGKHNFDDKDDINLIFEPSRDVYVDMQITKQQVPGLLPFCDNLHSCSERRVVSARNSTDGVTWSDDLGLRVPDNATDPPELQFYRARPFFVAPGRVVAHVLLYAPGPYVVPSDGGPYGRQPPMCDKYNMTHCHAPHMYEEWWLAPNAPARLEDVELWRRPASRTHAAPHDAFLMAQPALLEGGSSSGNAASTTPRHVWVGDGTVYTLPRHRIMGLYAPANGVFSTPAFELPAQQMLLNADASWHGYMVTAGSCDEGCAAYIMAELLDASTGQPLPGHNAGNCSLVNVNSTDIPLVWGGSQAQTAAFAGTMVQLRLHFRDATMYALTFAAAA